MLEGRRIVLVEDDEIMGASLVQRYGGLEGMVKAALTWGWACLDSALTDQLRQQLADRCKLTVL